MIEGGLALPCGDQDCGIPGGNAPLRLLAARTIPRSLDLGSPDIITATARTGATWCLHRRTVSSSCGGTDHEMFMMMIPTTFQETSQQILLEST